MVTNPRRMVLFPPPTKEGAERSEPETAPFGPVARVSKCGFFRWGRASSCPRVRGSIGHGFGLSVAFILALSRGVCWVGRG